MTATTDCTAKTLATRGKVAAEKFLTRQGYEVLEKEWSCPAGTICLVAMDGEELVFVKVATRAYTGKGFPEEVQGDEERERLEGIAAAYLAAEDVPDDTQVRFDAVAILAIGESKAFLRHHRSAFAA